MNGDFLTATVLPAITGMATNQLNMSNSEALLDKQNAFTEKMWNMNNEYNTPINQLKRLKSAGFNPLASQIGNSPAQQVSSSSQSAPQMQNPLDTASLGQLQIQEATAQGQRIDNQFKAAKATAEIAEIYSSISERMTNIDKILADKKVSEEQAVNLRKEREALQYQIDNILPAQLRNINSQSDLYDTQKEFIPKNYENDKNRIDIAQQEANTDFFNAVTNRFNANTEQIKANLMKIATEKQIEVSDKEIELMSKTIKETSQRIKNAKASERQSIIQSGIDMLNYQWRKDNPGIYTWQQFWAPLAGTAAAGATVYRAVKKGKSKKSKSSQPSKQSGTPPIPYN